MIERTPAFLVAHGIVQNVMFRQTVIRACKSRGIDGGATNDPTDRTKVEISLYGEKDKLDSFINELKSGKQLNSWGAKIDTLEIVDTGLPPLSHTVHTENINDFNWNPNCEFYI